MNSLTLLFLLALASNVYAESKADLIDKATKDKIYIERTMFISDKVKEAKQRDIDSVLQSDLHDSKSEKPEKTEKDSK